MKLSFKTILHSFVALTMIGMVFSSGVLAQAQTGIDSLKQEIEQLKMEKQTEVERAEEMRKERERFVKEIRRVENLNSKYSKQLEGLEGQMASQEAAFGERLKNLESRLDENQTRAPQELAAYEKPITSSLEVEMQAAGIFMQGGDLDPEDEKFKEELALAHYNMGNVYFERGEYQRSVVEYYQAVDLMPYDADAHYNLAFVSGEYVGDQETALKHYQWYLYLRPKAEDRKLVEEKMVVAKLNLRGRLGVKIEDQEKAGHMNIGR